MCQCIALLRQLILLLLVAQKVLVVDNYIFSTLICHDGLITSLMRKLLFSRPGKQYVLGNGSLLLSSPAWAEGTVFC